jgi:hypothetical protein
MVEWGHKCLLEYIQKNLNGSVWILRGEGRKISFSIAHEVHTKLLDFGNLASFKS